MILLGEHSVVHGRPAIAAGMALGCSARAMLTANAGDSLLGLAVERARGSVDAESLPEREQLRRAFALAVRALPLRAAGPRSA